MVDDRSEDAASAEPGRPRREPPTIDLEATSVSESPKAEAQESGHGAAAPAAEAMAASAAEPVPPEHSQSAPPRSISPWAIAPVSGAVAAALVIGVGWVLGWPAVQAPSPAPQLNAAAIDGLSGRLAGLESKLARPAGPVTDPAIGARIEAVEKSVAALRSELATARAQAEKLALSVSELKALPRGEGAASAPAATDLSDVNERIAQIDRASKAQQSEIAALKAAEAKPVETKVADDPALRRVVAATLLDLAVRHGDSFAAQLSAAKPFAASADALKPLEAFAASGIPSAAALCRELVAIVPKLAPSAPEAETTGSGIVDRLQAGAAKLVRIQRADTTGTDRASVVARVTAAALRNELNDARRELGTLPPADRAAAQPWLDKADAREAAVAASRKFAADAMNALATAK
jgi:hypothetical protein